MDEGGGSLAEHNDKTFLVFLRFTVFQLVVVLSFRLLLPPRQVPLAS